MASQDDDEKLLEDTLKLLPKLLKQRQATLEERAKEVQQMTEALQNEKAILNGNNKPSDVLHLNIGGNLLCVTRRTLTSIAGSMLAIKFSGRWDDSIEKDRDGNYFIDQPIELFKPLVDFLRARACETPLAPLAQAPDFGKDLRKFRDFVRMVEFYGLTSAVYPTEVVLHRGNPHSTYQKSSSSSSSSNFGSTTTSEEWSTFTLQTKGHDRQIQSFEINLLQFARAQIGWIIPNKFKGSLSSTSNGGSSSNHNHVLQGVGDTKHSVALDCTRCGLLSDGSFFPIEDGFGIRRNENGHAKEEEEEEEDGEKETVIRCEGRGDKWFINGKLVVMCVSSVQQEEDVKCVFPGDWGYYTEALIPAISIQGQWHVTQVEFSIP